MSPIELNDSHKSKLLEMCKVLFPKYYHLGFYSAQSGTLQISKTKDDLVFIHWFEFCMRYLTSKLDLLYFEKIMNPLDPFHVSNKNKNLEYPENWKELWENRPFEKFNKICNGSEYKKHPIDYLYEQFKQLKINK